MKKISLLSVAILALIMCRGLMAAPADDTYTLALWHMDSTVSTGGRLYVLDANTVQTGRTNDLKLGSAAGVGEPNVVSGQEGNALSFDGIDDICLSSDKWWGHYAVNVDFWIKPKNLSLTTEQEVVYAGAWFIRILTDGSIKAWCYQNAGPVKSLALPLSLDAWQHVILSAQDGVMSLSVDAASTTTPIGDMNSSMAASISIGCKSSTTRYFNGLIDEMKISAPIKAASAFLSPYADSYKTNVLFHMDEKQDDTVHVFVPDDANANPDRYLTNLKLASIYNRAYVLSGSTDGPQLATSQSGFNSCLSFDGATQNARIYTISQGTTVAGQDTFGVDGNNFRVEAWVKLDASTYGYSSKYSILYNYGRFALYLIDSSTGWQLQFSCWYSESLGHGSVVKYPNKDAWHHIAGEWYMGKQRLYLDGVLVNSFTAPVTSVNTQPYYGSFLYVGSRSVGAEYWSGLIDEVRISAAVPGTPVCGYWGYYKGDVNKDCYVNFSDVDVMASQWLTSTLP